MYEGVVKCAYECSSASTARRYSLSPSMTSPLELTKLGHGDGDGDQDWDGLVEDRPTSLSVDSLFA